MSGYRPTPWRAYESTLLAEPRWTVRDAHGVRVPACGDEATVSLIAAAPELLETARNLELWYRAGGCKHTSPDVLMKGLGEAIEKAEGGA